jgi:transcription antitermination factor NusA-like protein
LVDAFTPAKVISATITQEQNSYGETITYALVIVPNEHLKMAIGTKGVSVQLVKRLTDIQEIRVINYETAQDEEINFE